ncbi:ABC transporter substrate-binding protein [Halorientalis litorea]|uniref:ABC transporter substrate-binding protein n=1 Tax=Halorientalis litorea TaxID=2931977 RepID=UPI001FF17454|nr:ABC transporter substrate-binding protein [Halorientalis litorea]
MVNDGKQAADSEGYSDGASDTVTRGIVDRRRFLQAAGTSAAALGLAGCLNQGDGGGGDGDGGGDGGSDGGGIGDTVKIGVLAPNPSDNPIGASIANGARLAAQHINDDGGIGDAEVEVVVENTEESPQTGRNRYQTLALEEQVDATTGVFTSEVLLAIMDDIANQQIPHMTAGAATPEASALVNESYDQYKYHFRTGPINAHHLGENLVDFMDAKNDDIGWESVAVLVEDYAWTEPVSDVLNEQLGDTGIDIAMSRRYASGTEDFSPIYDEVESSGADAAFIAMAHTGTPAVVQWAQQQRPFEFGGIHVPMQLPSYYEATGGACRFGVTQNSATPTAEVTENTVPFANAFEEEFDQFPVYTGYITYDAVNQYANVVAAQESKAADDVVSGLEGSSYTGTAGTIEYYGPDHEFAHDVKYEEGLVWPVFQQWQEGEDGSGSQEVIYPDDLATADYQAPPWV